MKATITLDFLNGDLGERKLQLTAPYTLEGGLTVGQATSTMMACEGVMTRGAPGLLSSAESLSAGEDSW